ncbi:MAG: FAD-binding oxidoreductase, partial [Nitrospirae bacterium]|nr:FAD-binding oxidoreductase [Nitrospirota bacterium]
MKISNWGKFPSINAIVKNFSLSNELKNELPGYKPVIARGLGRCYGDSSLSKYILSTLKFNRITSLNAVDGIIVCQAGVSLKEMIEIIVPKGWFLPVTPGTKFVTIGGAVASDVHGKNHHQVGSFSEFIIYLDVLLSDGSVIRCSREKNIEIFHGVCGGMGLTGIILAVSLKLKKINTSFIKQKLIKTKHLTETMDLFNQHEQRTYSVAWIDCLSSGSSLGRGVLMLGEHARNEEIKADKFGK